MANHVRQQIRERIAANVTGLTTTGSNVFQSRVYPLQVSQLPALLVYSLSESAEIDSLTPPRGSTRALQVAIEAVTKQSADLDDKLDTICKEVEVALAADLTVNNLADDIYLESTEITLDEKSEKPTGRALMTWRVQYRVRETAPDAAI